MNKTASFVRLDFCTLKPYIRSIYLLIAIGLIIGISSQSLSTLSAIIMMGLMIQMSYPFSIGEKNGMDTLYATLSLRRRNVVVGRYAFAFLTEFVAVIFIVLLSLLFSNMFSMNSSLSEILFPLCLLSFLFSLMVAVQYPIFFKLGYTKAKSFTYVPLLLIFMFIGLWPTIADKFTISVDWAAVWEVVSANPPLMYGLPVGIGFLFLALSCAFSCRLYGKRDI
jgi:ABC-2 type transport system permease protein